MDAATSTIANVAVSHNGIAIIGAITPIKPAITPAVQSKYPVEYVVISYPTLLTNTTPSYVPATGFLVVVVFYNNCV